jgi:hypothetical protein
MSFLHKSRGGCGFTHVFIAGFPAATQGATVLYDFEVLRDGSVIQTETIHLPDIRDAWPAIRRLARTFCERGHRIRVKDQAGGIVILTGVAAVRHHGEDETTE